MRIRSLIISATLIGALVLTLAAIAFAADPFVGTWKMNVAKSKAPNPGMLPKSEIIKNEGLDNGLKSTYDGVDAEDKTYHIVWSGNYDGKDYPATGSPNWDTCSEKKISPNILVIVDKKAGKEVASYRCTVSNDGKTVSCIGKAKDAKEQDQSLTCVYDRQ
jgi:hypothetical protein